MMKKRFMVCGVFLAVVVALSVLSVSLMTAGAEAEISPAPVQDTPPTNSSVEEKEPEENEPLTVYTSGLLVALSEEEMVE
ncbi:MAG: hypothetical protein HFE94_07465, partial [Acutalibacter sp.]|nr:hypothetical protein [Acutalibacter sp.]